MSKSTKTPASYRQRTYRSLVDPQGLVVSRVVVQQTDLQVMAPRDVTRQVFDMVTKYRVQLENYLARNSNFLTSMVPLKDDPLAPAIVKSMIRAGRDSGVGPMAAVAGVLAEYVGQDLLAEGNREVIVENGGDIFLARDQESVIAVFAGESPLSYRLGIKINPERTPLGICSSSGTVGHSLSFGCADSVTVLARSTALADSAATRLGNEFKSAQDINHTLSVAEGIPGISGVVLIKGEHLGAWGDVELVPLSGITENRPLSNGGH